ncbi:prephenate dehydrogenase [Nocardioides ginsengisegetis]|uniref:Prephenate dehydrogenase n=1 Tax=Nocardioides ginsengisegetis TaxID=661491 RepID=A0A7W3IYY5_9ACTN|nr:prephenate dehydrogenase [Nocardioides ginsengisegetis]MBA8803176.1 prephenate dehydrogenase [Nocardioides ginsengisegetis]
MAEAIATAVRGPVLVVGTGLLGTSIGLALHRQGVEVWLRDLVAENVRTASQLGAGVPAPGQGAPALVVVCVPPDLLGAEIGAALATYPEAVVTDVGSVKSAPLAAVGQHPGRGRYVGSHPMAGSERSGPLAASSSLFDGRPWAVTPHPDADPGAVAAVTALAEACGATPVPMAPDEHDRAVARISHVPHLLAVLVAGRLADAPADHLALSGQGVRDVTRVAGGDPALWEQIIEGNAPAVLGLLSEVRGQLELLIEAVTTGERDQLGALLARGQAGTQAIPGKHGGPPRPQRSVFVSVPDHPGELARLFADAGASEVNIEDIHIDHDPGRPVGLVELLVEEARADHLLASLESRGWVTHR